MGSVTLKDLLDQGQSDEVIGKMKVLNVLESLPGLGKVKARRAMDEVGISETRRVQGLGSSSAASCSRAGRIRSGTLLPRGPFAIVRAPECPLRWLGAAMSAWASGLGLPPGQSKVSG